MTRHAVFIISYLLLTIHPLIAQNTWRQVSSANQRRVEATSIVYQDKLYVFHGYNQGWKVSHTSEAYDPITDTWTELAPLPSGPRSGFTHNGIAIDGDEVWLVGGKSGWANALFNKVWIYNFTQDTWRQGPELPLNIGTGSLIKLGRKLHFFGGGTHPPNQETRNGNFCVLSDKYYILDLDNPNPTWELQPAVLPNKVRRIHQGAILLNGLFYVTGGQKGHDCGNTDLTSFYQYNPYDQVWTQLPDMPVRASHIEPCTFTVDGDIYIASGERGDRPGGFVLKYDMQDSTWAIIDSIRNAEGELVELIAPSAKVIGDQLIVCHGFSRGKFFKETFARDFPRDTTQVNELGFNPQDIQVLLRYGTDSTQKSAWLWTNRGATNYELQYEDLPTWLHMKKDTVSVVDESAVEFFFTLQSDSLLPGVYTYDIQATAPNYEATNLHIELLIELDSTQVPIPPHSLQVRSFNFYQVILDWQAGSDNTQGYEIYRRSDTTQDFTFLAFTADTSLIDTSVNSSTYYEYQVRAINNNGASGFSNLISLITLPNPPQRPTILSVIPLSEQSMKIDWEINPEDQDFFQLYRSTEKDGGFEKIADRITTFSYQDSLLSPSTTYYYRVRARNRGGFSLFSKVLGDTTLAPKIEPPLAPSDLQAESIRNNLATLAWQDNSETEAYFEVFRREIRQAEFELIAQTLFPVYLDSALQKQQTYFYQVRAVNEGGSSDFSNIAEVSTTVITSVPEQDDLSSIIPEAYPNPSDGLYTLNLEEIAYQPIYLRIMNAFGHVLQEEIRLAPPVLNIDLSNQAPGMYYLLLRRQNQEVTRVLMKK